MTTLIKDPRSITRTPLAHGDDVEAALRGDVLARAHQEFGYVGESFGARGPLAKALADLGIAPLDTNQVEQYKKSKERIWTKGRRTRAHVIATLVVPTVVWSVFFAIKMYFGLHLASDGSGSALGGMILTAGALTIVGECVANCIVDDTVSDLRCVRSWKTFAFGTKNYTGPSAETSFSDREMADLATRGREYAREYLRGYASYIGYIANYTGYVPVHVLNTALQVRTACPSAAFYIDELTLEVAQIPRPLPDPFLKVSLGSESYYIAVWDEREFEAKM